MPNFPIIIYQHILFQVDIVDEMLRVAAGYPLNYTQSDIGIKGRSPTLQISYYQLTTEARKLSSNVQIVQ